MFDVPQDPNSVQSRIIDRRLAALAEQELARAELQLVSRRLEALDAFVSACEAAGALLGAASGLPVQPGRPRRPKKSYGDVRRAVVAVLRTAPVQGLPLAEIVRQVSVHLEVSTCQKSTAATLTRLKARGVAENIDFRWRLTAAGRNKPAAANSQS